MADDGGISRTQSEVINSGVAGGASNAQKKGSAKEESNDDDDETSDLMFVGDVPLKLTAELGRLELKIRNLLSLNKGTVLELEKLAGEPLEIFVNGRLVCKGEVVVSGEKYGVRMTDIIDPTDALEAAPHPKKS
ncbi:MAG: flagellar motor switch protein FliN [Oligoflexia bacterium]|nr:flagellar motor switch protein FliN [Oligoflexia bacterium]MBF0366096.1 flagellar motor switch protein FliN [Oligoflexia bacterium]